LNDFDSSSMACSDPALWEPRPSDGLCESRSEMEVPCDPHESEKPDGAPDDRRGVLQRLGLGRLSFFFTICTGVGERLLAWVTPAHAEIGDSPARPEQHSIEWLDEWCNNVDMLDSSERDMPECPSGG
jgi:hypothetical protein